MGRPYTKEAGKQYGEWTVLFRVKSNKRGLAMWRCICNCGTVREVAGSTLRNGSSSGCAVCAAYKREIKKRADLTTTE